MAVEIPNNLFWGENSPKKYLKSLLDNIRLVNNVDPEKHPETYVVYPDTNSAFLVLEKTKEIGLTPYGEKTKGLPSEYHYTLIKALGYRQNIDGNYEVGFFSKHENDIYHKKDQEVINFNPVDAGMLFTRTVSSTEEIIASLKEAKNAYLYNQGKKIEDQIVFPKELGR
ncbi:MAG: hypothetical protein AAGU06_02855 [Candidatus Shapirobacteria bacterium]